jgi:pimeloyl-ACP methyl ester carboxylesterase
MVSFTLSGGYNHMADKVGKVTHPTLVLWGEGDRILGTADAAKFQKAIPHAKLIWIEQSGHTPHLEQPQKTAELILEHCNQPSLKL